jgi:uncharacterized protein (TIGR02217 family)
MAFFECEFPTVLSYRALGGPAFSTTINEGFSGYEQRNRNWANSRARWTVSLQTPSEFGADRHRFIELLETFFLTVSGRADAFRLKDHKDYTARSQQIAIGNGSQTAFQLIRTYTVAGRSYVRTVAKPIAPPATDYRGSVLSNTVKVYKNAALQPASAYTLNATTGVFTFGVAPAPGDVISADFDFHHPVRFDSDEFQAQIDESALATSGPLVSWNSITLVEVRL